MTRHDTEDRQHWYAHGADKELVFCERVAPHYDLNVTLNPAKTTDPTVIDLLLTLPGCPPAPADLKTQETPFFTAARYGKDPALTVTFNLKDLVHYERRYPDAHILYHVNWLERSYQPGQGRPITVPRVHGVWLTSVPQIRQLIEAGRAPIHAYQRRVTDTQGNAKDSYLLALTDLRRLPRRR